MLYALEDAEPFLTIQFLLRYPQLHISNVSIDNAVVFGGVTVSNQSSRDIYGNAVIESATAIRLVYILDTSLVSQVWIRQFVAVMSELHYDDLKLFYTSSRSLADEMERNGMARKNKSENSNNPLEVFFCRESEKVESDNITRGCTGRNGIIRLFATAYPINLGCCG